MMRPDDHAHLAGLRDTTTAALANAIAPGPVALLDVPNQRNVATRSSGPARSLTSAAWAATSGT